MDGWSKIGRSLLRDYARTTDYNAAITFRFFTVALDDKCVLHRSTVDLYYSRNLLTLTRFLAVMFSLLFDCFKMFLAIHTRSRP